MKPDSLAIRIASRYLWSRKSHSAVTAIAVAGVCGVALATMAIICVLSVFNGFRDAIMGRDSRIIPDLLVEPVRGSLIDDADSLELAIGNVPGVAVTSAAVTDEAVAYYDSHQLPIRLLGVRPDAYRRLTAIDSLLVTGRWKPQLQQLTETKEAKDLSPADEEQIDGLASEEFDEAALFEASDLSDETAEEPELPASPVLASVGVASNLGLPPATDAGIIVFLPRRTADINFANPATGFMLDSLEVTGVFRSDQSEFDGATLITDIETARRLLEYDTQANSIYVGLDKGAGLATVQSRIEEILGPAYKVSDRERQQTLHFRMVSIEKWITFLLLSFILLIASFNIISTLSMLIVEKRRNILTMTDFGATRGFIGRVFFYESVMVCLIGSATGTVLGVVLCLLQMQFGLITIPGSSDMLLSVYPVRLNIWDILLVLILSIGIAILTGAVASAYAAKTASVKAKKK